MTDIARVGWSAIMAAIRFDTSKLQGAVAQRLYHLRTLLFHQENTEVRFRRCYPNIEEHFTDPSPMVGLVIDHVQ
jgi:hypothetical protein